MAFAEADAMAFAELRHSRMMARAATAVAAALNARNIPSVTAAHGVP